jgi:two-component system OmpR family sensor kinase
MTRVPLRIRLTLAFALAMAAVLGITGLHLYDRVSATLDEQVDHALVVRVEDLTALAGRREATPLPNALTEEEEDSFAQILFRSGRVRDASPGAGDEPLLSGDHLARARRQTTVVERNHSRLATPTQTGDIVIAGASLGDRDEALGALLMQLLIGGPIALLFASLAGYLLAGAALRPVESMRRRAAEISATVGGRRLPEPDGDDEIARLARTLNEMLARLEAGLERERRFAAEASHELRTPLASLKAELELALRRPRSPAELRAAIASAAEETDRLAALAVDLLVLARSDEGELHVDRKPVRACELLETVARRYAARADEAGLALEVAAPPALEGSGDPALLEQAVGNLVDNALRYGSGTVRLEASGDNGSLALCVIDQGTGFAPDFLPRAFERFSRADGSRARGSAGLGLAIVDAVARAHGGTASAGNTARGGARVTLTLPR